ncbi:MAG: rhomboid family intramembrane serine protease [Bacteroidetes bacterium]|nr:rhomboid family intramembrane serine protease [Bacteroidota bacterium]
MTDFRPSRFQILPPVVKNLIIINAIMLFAKYALERMGIDLDNYLGLHYWKSQHYHFWQYFTHMFMHGNITHLVFNMFALWMFGSVLENVWGPKRFITFYIISGLGAAFLYMGVIAYQLNVFQHAFEVYQSNPTVDQYGLFIAQHKLQWIPQFMELKAVWENNPNIAGASQRSINLINEYQILRYDESMVGASGAIFGVLFAFGYLFPNTLLYIYFLVPIKAKWFVALYAIVELVALIQNDPTDNIAHFAHLGGMLVAFVLLKIWSKNNRRDFF